jgi:molybdate/tungstate transport system substrate-binding protein
VRGAVKTRGEPLLTWTLETSDTRERLMIHGRCAPIKALQVAAFALSLLTASKVAAEQTVTVLYAGSLVGQMERSIGPEFKRQSGDDFKGDAGGSQQLARQLKDGTLKGDVFISADPKVNALLSGSANADLVKWYVIFAESPLVLGINPSGRFAENSKGKSWEELLMVPGAKIGRTDPAKDPKGAFTVEFLKKVDKPKLAESVLEHSSVLPEEALVKKVQAGELDIGFFYSVETTGAGLTAIDLPSSITPKATYTLTILENAPNPDGGKKFVSFLLGPKGSELMKKHGLSLLHPQLAGEDPAVPQAIRSLLAK